MTRLAVVVAVAVLSACALSHAPSPAATDEDADVRIGPEAGVEAGVDAGVDAGVEPGDASSPDVPDASVVPCGANACFHGEVCCSEMCGICGTAGACPTGPPCF